MIVICGHYSERQIKREGYYLFIYFWEQIGREVYLFKDEKGGRKLTFSTPGRTMAFPFSFDFSVCKN